MGEEKNFEERVKEYLKEQGCWFIKYWGGAAYTKAGVPDLLVCCHGEFIGVELKAEKGQPSLLQLRTLKAIQNAGGWGILLYPAEFPQFKKFITNRIQNKIWYLLNIQNQNCWKQKLQGKE